MVAMMKMRKILGKLVVGGDGIELKMVSMRVGLMIVLLMITLIVMMGGGGDEVSIGLIIVMKMWWRWR